jgi:hypothetical protein
VPYSCVSLCAGLLLSLDYNKASIKIKGGLAMSNLENALHELRARRSGMHVELQKLDQIIAGIESLNGAGARNVRPTQTVSAAATKTTVSTPAKRTMSAAARRKISLAQKARWAKVQGHTPKSKHTISAAGRRRIAAAARARWAKVRAAKKAA